jgi:hypothetical protein
MFQALGGAGLRVTVVGVQKDGGALDRRASRISSGSMFGFATTSNFTM